jgi:copper oxidase (laccase) domain-containing protein
VAAAHAGWRGAAGGVLEAAVDAMQSLGATRRGIRAAVGPCIGLGAYEVGADFEAALAAADLQSVSFFQKLSSWDKPHFDLAGYAGHRLRRLRLSSVELFAPCTWENESEFFSYRRAQQRGEPDYGRQISAIVVT